MIVGLAFLRALVDVGEDAEAELGILVQDLPLRPVIDEIRLRERLVEQDVRITAQTCLRPSGPRSAVRMSRQVDASCSSVYPMG